jgi:preprotein translocase subunit YajC
MSIILIIILLVFMFDFTKLRQQNDRMIEQNEKMISLLEEIKK